MNKKKTKKLPGDIIAKKPRESEIAKSSFTVEERNLTSRTFSSPVILITIFVILIALGTLLLVLPVSQTSGEFGDPLTAVFTATSAVTVTGLTVTETGTHWTVFGQSVILFLIFVGGLGFMTLAAFLLAVLGKRVSIAQRLLIRESLSVDRMGGLQKLSIAIVFTAVFIQILGFILLLSRLIFLYEYDTAIWLSLFHSISGFNNAGFVISPSGYSPLIGPDNKIVLLIIGSLITLGSLSYWVVLDLATKRNFREFSLVTKIVLMMTVVMTSLASISFLLSEYGNYSTIGSLNLSDKVIISIFEGISGRTAGFSTIDYTNALPATEVLMTFMMFIGGATASVAGGVKVTTFLILVLSVIALIREKTYVSAFGREIDQDTIKRSYAVFFISLAFVFMCIFLLALTNSTIQFDRIVFESFSAFGTVGLSSGATETLNTFGRIVLILTMFIGRIGPLIIGLKMVPNQDSSSYRPASETVTIG